MSADAIIHCLREITDYAAFERLCNNLMSIAGYINIEPLGGMQDAGRDAIFFNRDSKEVTIFAYTVRKDWRAKLFEDAEKIRRHGHVCNHFVFVCTSTFSAGERDELVGMVKLSFGWRLDLFGLERLRMLITERSDVLTYFPNIFPPALFQRAWRQVRAAPQPLSTRENQPMRGAVEARSFLGEVHKTEREAYEWVQRTRSFHFQPLLRVIREIENTAGRLEAGRGFLLAIAKNDAQGSATGPQLMRVCDELDRSGIFQANWKLRRMLARVVGNIVAFQLDGKDGSIVDRFCEPRLPTRRGQLLLAEAATESTRAAAAFGSRILRAILLSGHPQVAWQLLKRWPRIEPQISSRLSLREIFEQGNSFIRRRLFLTRLLADSDSSITMGELLNEIGHFARENADVRFYEALADWIALNTSVSVLGARPVRIDEVLDVAEAGTLDRGFAKRMARALELDAIDRDLRLANATYHSHPDERFSEGRYGFTRHYVRRAITLVSKDELDGLLDELLKSANEGIRWAVAAEVLHWWLFLPDPTLAWNVVLRLVGDDHPWVVREVLQQLAEDPLLCQAVSLTHLRMRAQESRQRFLADGWGTEELEGPILRIAALDPAGFERPTALGTS